MKETPAFLDFEASSLSPHSYPIEVAWNREDSSIETHLISPWDIESWTDWDSAAERVHGIRREKLLTDGKHPLLICNLMNEQLAGKMVYTDSPKFDGMWLSQLFSVCDGIAPNFQLKHIDELLVSLICPGIAGRTYGLIKIEVLKREARKQKSKQHRASWDVDYLIQLWRLASFETRTLYSRIR
jgi:hypothetical protein